MTRHLSVVSAQPSAARSDWELLVAGEPVTMQQCDLIAFANSDWAGLDPARDPDSYTLAEVMLDWYHHHVGKDRRTRGDRALDLAVTLRRYLLPYVLETARSSGKPTAAAFRVQHAETLARILSGAAPLPAATVAGDILGRYGAACVWLTVADASEVSVDGDTGVTAAVKSGRLPVRHLNDGRVMVAAADLRAAGLLRERTTEQPHGLARATAGNHLRVLRECLTRAEDLGVTLTGRFTKVRAVEPLTAQRQRPESEPLNGAVCVTAVAAVCAYLSPIMQVALWLLRLTGMRIGEAYGLNVDDYLVDDEGQGWLRIYTQGGAECLVRDEHDGKLRVATTKPHTKTKQSVRTIPIPMVLRRLLDDLVRLHHTDPDTGVVDTSARLIPGLRSENDGGIAALRSALAKAVAAVNKRGLAVPTFTPHDLRASFITDLYDARIDERLQEWFTGHAFGTTVHSGYDLGPGSGELLPVATAVDGLAADAGVDDLRRPTATRESFGRATRRGARADALAADLLACGWLLARGAVPPLLSAHSAAHVPATPSHEELLDSAGVARRAGVTPVTARRWLREGVIASIPSMWGTRQVLLATTADVDAFLASRSHGMTLAELAHDTGWTYHQLLHLLPCLGIEANTHRGGTIRLTDAQADKVRNEVNRRAAAAKHAVPLDEAADRLDLTRLTVETLLRSGELTLAPAPDATRHRYVSVDSINTYLARHPVAAPRSAEPQRLVPQELARKALGLNRHTLTFLVTSRQLIARTPGRRMHLTLNSIERYAADRPDLVDAVAVCRSTSKPERLRLGSSPDLPAP